MPPTMAGGGGSGPVNGVLLPILSKPVDGFPSTISALYARKIAKSFPRLNPEWLKMSKIIVKLANTNM